MFAGKQLADQLEGWIAQPGGLSSGVVLLRIDPDEVRPRLVDASAVTDAGAVNGSRARRKRGRGQSRAAARVEASGGASWEAGPTSAAGANVTS